jgi:hypothetical protein
MKPFAGVGFAPVLILIVVLLVLTPIVLWAMQVAVALLWLATKICVSVLVLLGVLYCIKIMARKMNH